MTLVERVYRLRRLASKCGGDGLDMDEVEELSALEAGFPVGDRRRGFGRLALAATAAVRRAERHDQVTLVDIGPGGVACRDLPRAREGDQLELSFFDPETRVSHRFAARVAWVDQRDDGNRVGLCFVGAPIEVRHGEPRRRRRITEPLLEVAA